MSDTRSTVNAGSGVTLPRGRKPPRKAGASLSAKGEFPGSAEGAHSAFPRGQAQPQPVDRENPLGHGHAQAGVGQRQVLDVEQAGERGQVRRAFRLPGAWTLVEHPPRFQVPHPRTAAEETSGDPARSAGGPRAGGRPRPKAGARSQGPKAQASAGRRIARRPDREAVPPLGASARSTQGRRRCGRYTAAASASAATPSRAVNPAPHQRAVRLRVTDPPGGGPRRAPSHHARLYCLATNPGEKCGPGSDRLLQGGTLFPEAQVLRSGSLRKKSPREGFRIVGNIY